MSKTKDRILQQLDYESDGMSDINEDITDVFRLDFSDNDTWLQGPIRNQAGSSVAHLDTASSDDLGCESLDSHDHRRSIDTRTFTRPKKRPGRTNFESILEAPASPSTDVWKSPNSPNIVREVVKDESVPIRDRRESTPPMLRPYNQGVSSVCSADTATTSGQQSLEAFLNMSQSKGIDSFINLAQPEFTDDIMNVSQPSMLCSSFLSMTVDDLSRTITDSPPINQTMNRSSIDNSQILTESMMHTSMFGDTAEIHFDDTFAKNSANVTVFENTDFCESMDRTFIGEPATITEGSLKDTLDSTMLNSLDATYTPSRMNAAVTNNLLPNDPHASYIVHRHSSQASDMKHTLDDASFVVRTEAASDASYVVRTEAPGNASYVVRNEAANNASFIIRTNAASDASFIIRSATPDSTEDTMPRLNIPNLDERNETFDVRDSDATFDKTPVASPIKPPVNSTFSTAGPETERLSVTIEQCDKFDGSHNLEATFDKTPVSSPIKSPANTTFKTAENTTFKSPSTIEQNHTFNMQNHFLPHDRPAIGSPRKLSLNSTLKAPAPLSEKTVVTADHAVNSTFNAPTKMDTTCEHNANRNNTYKKSAAPERPRKENYPTNNLTAKSAENVVKGNRGASLESLDSTFCKPAPRLPSKLNAPRALSRLPQTLQKSNPNIISSSLKSINTVGRSAIPSFGFNKLARPSTTRNTEGSLSSKLYSLGKTKSGSEQRLEGSRNSGDFQKTGTGGSTESIESTQSAHSAPDFDDRLSVCSDSSSTSYNMRTMNLDDLQKIARLREECSKPQSTPEPKRRVLENTWVEASKNLPSPILKQGTLQESRGSSPGGLNSPAKTSSPLLSPAESMQNLTIDISQPKANNIHGNKLTVPEVKKLVTTKLTEPSVKPAKSSGENKSGLKPPGIPSIGNRPASGIPRPASRIPAPRFGRPAAKTNQGDIKKGCL